MSQITPVILTGAAGRMGQEAIRAIISHSETSLQGALTRATGFGLDAGSLIGLSEPTGVILSKDLEALLDAAPTGTVLVELTKGQASFEHAQAALRHQIPVVIGATGLSEGQIESLRQQSQAESCGVLLAPNFSLGALLMMRFAAGGCSLFFLGRNH